MIQIIIGSVISFVITILLLPILVRLAANKKIYVIRQYRKVHKQNTSSLGGIAIFAGVLFVLLFFSSFANLQDIKYYIAAGSFIFLVGLRDDLYEVKPINKLFGQIVAATIIIFLGKSRIEYFDLLTPDNQLSYWVSIVLSFIIIIWFINAYNFFDGIDLQATLIAIVVLFPSAIWFYLAAQYNLSLLLFATSTALIAFIFFNYHPSKIFMGDTGTATIGFVMAFMFIKFINLNHLESLSDIHVPYPFIFGLLILQLPLSDSLRVVIYRIIRKKSPTMADKNHLHHLLLLLNWNQEKIAGFSASYTLIIMIANLFLFIHHINIVLILILNLITISTLYFIIGMHLNHLKNKE